jgi:two-component system phosphate regulon sensor histidine kinase PhoR
VGRDLAEALRDPAVLDAADAVLAEAGARSAEFQTAAPVARDFAAQVARLTRPAADGALAILTLRDVTEMRRMERMRADFVANASHEIRTPLATLAGCVETLQGPARDDPEAHERFLAIMEQQASRMTRLVADLLSLSRIELNEHSAPTGLVRLPELLGRVVDGLAPNAEAAGVRLEIAAAAGLPPAIGDENELWQVFQNLIDNAIKYGAEGKLVEIRCELAERPLAGGRSALRVAVRDRGPGIAHEHLPRLTERFYRADAARSRELGGTGLGLAIVKHIVNRHRGALTIESNPGEGAQFTVHLPAESGAAGPTVIKPSSNLH